MSKENRLPPSEAVEAAPVVAKTVERKSPKEWAFATGNGPKANTSKNKWEVSHGMSAPRGSVYHEVASVLHGWKEHEHHEGSPILLTQEEYLAALKATMPEAGNPVPHKSALSPHKGGTVRVTFKG